MTRLALLSVVLLRLAPLPGCDGTETDDSDGVLIRVENVSGVDFLKGAGTREQCRW